jgi:hypothetical protein
MQIVEEYIDSNHRLQILIQDGGSTVLLCEHQQLLICDERSPKLGSLLFRDSSELQNSNLKSILYCKPKWHNKANRRELVLTKVFHAIH